MCVCVAVVVCLVRVSLSCVVLSGFVPLPDLVVYHDPRTLWLVIIEYR